MDFDFEFGRRIASVDLVKWCAENGEVTKMLPVGWLVELNRTSGAVFVIQRKRKDKKKRRNKISWIRQGIQ